MYIDAKDVKVGRTYILCENEGNTPFTVTAVYHVNKPEEGEVGTAIECVTLAGPTRFFEADKCGAYGLQIRTV